MLGGRPLTSAPTSYYCLAGETASTNSNASFSPDGLIVNTQKTNVMNMLPGLIQLNVHVTHL